MYPDTNLFINGEWRAAASGDTLKVINPATGEPIGKVAHAGKTDLDRALESAERGFEAWRKVSAFDRYKVMRKAAENLRANAEAIGRAMTIEQGKPLAEAKLETMFGADIIDWFGEEGRRAYGRIVPPRAGAVVQLVFKEPVGPCAAFTPWNFPINQAVRKLSAALAAGCSVILKGPEETPASCAMLVKAFEDAGIPNGTINLLYGTPAEISEYLIPHPVVRKISFTGSTVVGKKLASLAGLHMKRITMELGGHAPAIVFDDADLDTAVNILAANKFRNAGQVCVAPTRFLVQEQVFDNFVTKFTAAAKSLKVGNGLEPGVKMGPVANIRRLEAMEALVADAESRGAKIKAGGKRIGNQGFFFEPTVITDASVETRVMNEEPFGPLATINRFRTYDEVIREANRLPYGLAAYAYTTSAKTVADLGAGIESGMVSINHHGLALPEIPFGGIKDSGYGSEGGSEGIEPYLSFKLVTQTAPL